jgi:hypothetical protein
VTAMEAGARRGTGDHFFKTHFDLIYFYSILHYYFQDVGLVGHDAGGMALNPVIHSGCPSAATRIRTLVWSFTATWLRTLGGGGVVSGGDDGVEL